jgi:uncharacterized protein (TIGR03067 family)
MRPILTLFLLILAISGHAQTPDPTTFTGFNGTWIPIQQELAGKVLSREAFKNQRLVIADSTYTVTAEHVDKGVVRIAGNKMDIYSREGVNQGKHFTAIYKIDKDLLTICYNLGGDSYPENYDTKGKSLFFCSTFKRTTGN